LSAPATVIAQDAHAERMDAIYGVQRHFYDLTRKYYLLGRDRLIREIDVPMAGSVLEAGCGTGRNLAAVGMRYPTARLFGLDISNEMLKSAQQSLARRALEGRSKICVADATAFDPLALFGRTDFDRVFLSYSVSMIPDWRAAIEAAMAAVAKGGSLHIVDFGQQQGLPRWFRQGLKRWLARFHVTPRADLFDYCRETAQRNGWRCSTQALYRDYAWSVTLSRPA
jgi:S-adenosylmethionine-diacylgycerolhomoserine-N-methlytransferase